MKSLHEKSAEIQYYYMGYYIHSCPKMRYKGNLAASYLLCPETYRWFPIKDCVSKLDNSKYARLNDDIDAIDNDVCSQDDVNGIKILLGYSFLPFEVYRQRFGEVEVYENVAMLVGKKCASNLLFISSKDNN